MARLYEEVDLVRTLEPSADVIVGIKYLARGGCDPIEMGPSLVRTAQALLRIDSVPGGAAGGITHHASGSP